jgi:hypothetical protein
MLALSGNFVNLGGRPTMSENASFSERRSGVQPVPRNIHQLMTELQRFSLTRLEGFGWSIAFVRRAPFQEPMIVLADPSGNRHGVLLDDGSLDSNNGLQLRG